MRKFWNFDFLIVISENIAAKILATLRLQKNFIYMWKKFITLFGEKLKIFLFNLILKIFEILIKS